MNKIENIKIPDKVYQIKGFDSDFLEEADGPDRSFEDDGAIFVIRKGIQYVFYLGQEKGCLTSKDIPRYEKMLDKALEVE
jgi:hypothetical protein